MFTHDYSLSIQVRALARAGASVNLQNKLGQTPAHMALHGAKNAESLDEGREVVRMLSGLGGDLLCVDHAGDSLLHLAVALPGFEDEARLSLTEWLLAKGFSGKPHRNSKGLSPLDIARMAPKSGCYVPLTLLLEGSEAKVRSARGMVVCMKRKRGSEGVATLVIEASEDSTSTAMKRLRVDGEEESEEPAPSSRKRKLFRLVSEVEAVGGEDLPTHSLAGISVGSLLPPAPMAAGGAPGRARRFEQVGKRRKCGDKDALVISEHGTTAKATPTKNKVSAAQLQMLADLGMPVDLPEDYGQDQGADGPDEEVWAIYAEDETVLEDDDEVLEAEAVVHVSSLDFEFDYSAEGDQDEDLYGEDYDSNDEQYGYGSGGDEDDEEDELYIPRMDNPCT